ncbi:hypothetical protein C7M84_016591 [Penaeus vannamei]|uniref:Uncharacterized protein n=1 Tax=Penaeus vannamei TaxID=6689 RepID=A0A3R7M2G6_PENVA|nr:hypothetical protein C7M84_016591 [Penaeus vannamei]
MGGDREAVQHPNNPRPSAVHPPAPPPPFKKAARPAIGIDAQDPRRARTRPRDRAHARPRDTSQTGPDNKNPPRTTTSIRHKTPAYLQRRSPDLELSSQTTEPPDPRGAQINLDHHHATLEPADNRPPARTSNTPDSRPFMTDQQTPQMPIFLSIWPTGNRHFASTFPSVRRAAIISLSRRLSVASATGSTSSSCSRSLSRPLNAPERFRGDVSLLDRAQGSLPSLIVGSLSLSRRGACAALLSLCEAVVSSRGHERVRLYSRLSLFIPGRAYRGSSARVARFLPIRAPYASSYYFSSPLTPFLSFLSRTSDLDIPLVLSPHLSPLPFLLFHLSTTILLSFPLPSFSSYLFPIFPRFSLPFFLSFLLSPCISHSPSSHSRYHLISPLSPILTSYPPIPHCHLPLDISSLSSSRAGFTLDRTVGGLHPAASARRLGFLRAASSNHMITGGHGGGGPGWRDSSVLAISFSKYVPALARSSHVLHAGHDHCKRNMSNAH